MCLEHRSVPLNQPLRKREPIIRLSVAVPDSLNRQIEEWRLYTGNDKVEIIRQILTQWFDENPLPDHASSVKLGAL